MRVSAIPKIVIAALLSLAFASAASAATLVLNGSGQLAGALGVNVAGTLYDVHFRDASCNALNFPCQTPTGPLFTFTTEANSRLAAQALLDQVTIGQFATQTQNIFGCTQGGSASECWILVPWTVVGDGCFLCTATVNATAAALIPNGTNGFFGTILDRSDSTAGSFTVYALFTPSQSGVPEPGTWAIMLLGFGAIGLTIHRRRYTALVHPV